VSRDTAAARNPSVGQAIPGSSARWARRGRKACRPRVRVGRRTRRSPLQGRSRRAITSGRTPELDDVRAHRHAVRGRPQSDGKAGTGRPAGRTPRGRPLRPSVPRPTTRSLPGRKQQPFAGYSAEPEVPSRMEAVAQTTHGSGASICDGTTYVGSAQGRRQMGRDPRESGQSRHASHQLGSQAFRTPLCNSLHGKQHSALRADPVVQAGGSDSPPANVRTLPSRPVQERARRVGDAGSVQTGRLRRRQFNLRRRREGQESV
jgi:hypothetical protein